MRWFRLYDELLDDPKVQRLPPHLFKSWLNLLCLASKNGGVLPGDDDIAFRLRMSVHDAAQHVEDLILAGLIDIDPDKRRVPHNWSVRQYASDSSAERTRRYRQRRKRGGDVTGDGDGDGCVTVQSQIQSQRQKQKQSSDQTERRAGQAATERSEDQVFGVGFGRGRGRDGKALQEKLLRRAEGLGLSVSDLVSTVNERQPKNRAAYFTTIAVNQLKAQLPGIEDTVLRAALWDDDKAFGAVSNALMNIGEPR